MSETQRISVDPGRCGGRPRLRIRVRDALDPLAAGAGGDRDQAPYRQAARRRGADRG